MVVPLLTPETRCGHITLVSSELSGIPIVTSASVATSEYTEDCQLYSAGDVDALVGCLRSAIDQSQQLKNQAVARIPYKKEKYARSRWEAPIADFLNLAWKDEGQNRASTTCL